MYNSSRSRKKFGTPRRSYNRSRRRPQKKFSIGKLLLIAIVFFLLIRGGIMLFSSDTAIAAEASLDVRRGVVEFSLEGDDLWTRANSGQKFLEGDKIRCTGNCEATVELLDGGSVVVLAPNTAVTFIELEQKQSGTKNITLHVGRGTLWSTVADDEFANKKSHFIITTPHTEISANGSIFNLDTTVSDFIRVLRGNIELRIIDATGKKGERVAMHIGQQILLDTAARTVFETDDAAKAFENIDPTFEESEWNLKNLELFSPQEAAAIRHRIERSANPTQPDPSKNGLNSPQITTPNSGAVIPAIQDMLKLEGTAPVDAYRISVNGYTLTKFQPGDRKWSYFASKKFGTLVPGENTFDVVAVSRDGRESAPATIDVTYNATAEPVIVAEAENSFPVPIIQFPTLTDATQMYETSEPVLNISGIVDPQTVAVEVNDFRLKKFQAGNTTWKYIANAQYKNMVLGENLYTVVAIGPNDERSTATIRVNYTPK